MILSFLHSMFEHKYSIGIDLEYSAKGNFKATLCVLKKKGGELRQIETKTFDSYPLLFSYLKNSKPAPIYLNMRGEGIIQQIYEGENSMSTSKDLLENLQRLDGLQLRAFARATFLVSVIDKFKAEKLLVLGLHLGLNIAPLMSVIKTARITLDKHVLNIENDQVELNEISEDSHERIKGLIQTLDDQLSVSEACSFASALSFVQNENANIRGLETIEENTNEHSYRHKYNVVLKVSVVFILTLLLANYAAFDHYFSSNAQLQHRITVSRSELAKIEQKKAELQTKKQFAALNGLGAQSHLALYADQLALLLPVDTYLESLNVCPMQSSKRDKQVSFDKTSIHIRAGTSNTESINNYIEQIEKLDWVAQVSIESVVPKDETEQLQFSLILKLVKP